MDKVVLALPALILIMIGAMITGSAFTSTSQRSLSMPSNFGNLVFQNNNGYDSSGFPSYYGSEQKNIVMHVDISPYIGSIYQGQIQWKVMRADWSDVIAQGTLPYQRPQDFSFAVNLDFGTYVLGVYSGDKVLYWQHFSVTNPQSTWVVGLASIFIGVIFFIFAVKPGR